LGGLSDKGWHRWSGQVCSIQRSLPNFSLSHFTLPGKDARDFARALQGQKKRYSEVVVKLLELAPHGSALL
jgi:hypothetical protein